MNYTDIIKEVVGIAREAGREIMAIYKQGDTQVEVKADNSPLTMADRAANAVICRGLEGLAVQYPIISEENKAVPYEVRQKYEHYWLVDPLDGTKEFIKRNGEFTVNIALIRQGAPIAGVVYAPSTDDMYWSVKGEGAFWERSGQVERLTAQAFSTADEGLGIVCSRSHLNSATESFVEQFKSPDMVPKGSSLKFLIIARGQAHVYPRLAPTMEWDTAAAQSVLEEAGGQVIDAASGKPLQYNKADLLNPHFIAYGRVAGEMPVVS